MLIPARNAALVLVDVYPREGPEGEVVKSVIAPVKAAARSAGIPAVYVTNHLADSTDASSQWRQVWLRTLGEDVLETWAEPSDALRYLPEIAPADGDIVVHKQHYSGFADTELDGVLKSLGARDLFLVGFDARICVAATATDALSRNYRVFVLREAVATTERTSHGRCGGRVQARLAIHRGVRGLHGCCARLHICVSPDRRGVRVDAHVHVWPHQHSQAIDISPSIAAAGEVDALVPTLLASEVTAAVVVQPTVSGLDHNYLLAAVQTEHLRLVGLAQAEPEDRRSFELIGDLTASGAVVGFRLPLIRAGDKWIRTQAKDYWELAAEGRSVISVLSAPSQLQGVGRLASAHPAVSVVIDHLARFDLAE